FLEFVALKAERTLRSGRLFHSTLPTIVAVTGSRTRKPAVDPIMILDRKKVRDVHTGPIKNLFCISKAKISKKFAATKRLRSLTRYGMAAVFSWGPSNTAQRACSTDARLPPPWTLSGRCGRQLLRA